MQNFVYVVMRNSATARLVAECSRATGDDTGSRGARRERRARAVRAGAVRAGGRAGAGAVRALAARAPGEATF